MKYRAAWAMRHSCPHHTRSSQGQREMSSMRNAVSQSTLSFESSSARKAGEESSIEALDGPSHISTRDAGEGMSDIKRDPLSLLSSRCD